MDFTDLELRLLFFCSFVNSSVTAPDTVPAEVLTSGDLMYYYSDVTNDKIYSNTTGYFTGLPATTEGWGGIMAIGSRNISAPANTNPLVYCTTKITLSGDDYAVLNATLDDTSNGIVTTPWQESSGIGWTLVSNTASLMRMLVNTVTNAIANNIDPDAYTISAISKYVSVGDIVEIPIEIQNNPNIWGIW